MVLGRKKDRDKSAHGQIAKTPDPDFINYATHFNRKTILTKNGELIQIIRITGLNKDGDKDNPISLRDRIRDVIYDNTDNENKFAFWFHTIRRKKNVTTRLSDNYEEYLAQQINEQWVKGNDWQNKYANELYISIVSQSAEYSSGKQGGFARYFSYKAASKNYIANLKTLEKELSEFTDKVQNELSDTGAKILGITEWEGQYFSEPLRFLGKIINLKEDRYPLTFNDISRDLSGSRIVFGNRDVQVINNKKSHFCSILSLKEYIEVPLELMDKILNLDFEFIITQSFDFFADGKQLQNYHENLETLEISQDNALMEISGLGDYEDFDKRPKKDYGSLQTTITIITDNHEKLEEEIASALEEFGALGLIMIREDVFLEHCYWSRLPGNFTFLKRQKTTKTLKVPGFSAINSFPTGTFDGNQWGPAITTINTIINTPYFFNFHTFDSGNTVIQGPNGDEKNIFTNLLLCQALKLDCDIYFLDSTNSNKALIKCLEGEYHELDSNKDNPNLAKLNPFNLEDNEENTLFIEDLLISMTMFLKGKDVSSEVVSAKQIIHKVLSSKAPNFLVAFDALRTNETKNLYEKLKIWANGKLSHIFEAQDELDWNKKVTGFDFSAIMKQKPVVIPIFKYILHKILTKAKTSGRPAIIVIDEPVEFFNNPIFEKEYANLCEKAYQANSILVIKNSNKISLQNKAIVKTFFENSNTQIIFPSKPEEETYDQETFLLDESEMDALAYMTMNDQDNALIKKDDMPVIIKPELQHIEKFHDILSCNKIANTSIDEIIKNNPEIINDPQKLTEETLKIIQEVKKAEEEAVKAKIQAKMEKELGKKEGEEQTAQTKPQAPQEQNTNQIADLDESEESTTEPDNQEESKEEPKEPNETEEDPIEEDLYEPEGLQKLDELDEDLSDIGDTEDES